MELDGLWGRSRANPPFGAAQVCDALGGVQRHRRVGKHLGDAGQRCPRSLGVLTVFQMPVSQLGQRGGNLRGGTTRLPHEALDREPRASEVVQVLYQDLGEQQLAGHVVWEPLQLLADEERGFLRLPFFRVARAIE